MKIRKVLCPVDFSSLSRRELALAVEICGLFDAALVIEHNLDPRPPNYLAVRWMWSEGHEVSEEQKSTGAARELRDLLSALPPVVRGQARLTRGPIDLSLLYLARELPVDLIVMGSHGWSRGQHRSLTEQLVSRSPCAVLTLTEEFRRTSIFSGAADAHRILVPVPHGRQGRVAIAEAVELAETLSCRLDLVRVESGRREPGGHHHDEELRLRSMVPEHLAARAGCHVVRGTPAEEIVRLAKSIDATMIVTTSRRRAFPPRVFKNATSLGILHESPCPVWFAPLGRTRSHRGAAA